MGVDLLWCVGLVCRGVWLGRHVPLTFGAAGPKALRPVRRSEEAAA